MSKSQLTVILPVRNGEKFITAAVASVLNQTFKEFELWVLENGSEDRTAHIVRSLKDPRIKLFELGSVGVQGALQYALENAPTEWVARMDADDLMFPERLQTQLNFIQKNPEVVFVGTAYALLTPFGHVFEPPVTSGTREVTRELLACNHRFFGDPTVVFNRHAALRAGGADFDFPRVDGVPLLFRLLTQGRGWEIAKHLHLYRVRPGSLSRGNDHLEQAYRVRLKYAPEFTKAEPREIAQPSFWRFITKLEILSGDIKSIRRAFHLRNQEEPWRTREKLLLLYSLLDQFNFWHYRGRYRRRRDWEKIFRPLLDLDQKALPMAARENSYTNISSLGTIVGHQMKKKTAARIPSLTVILPAYNAEATIASAIASTLNQTYTDFELWVLENGSDDRTAEIAYSFSDPRMKVFELGPVGFQEALKYGIENSSSEWLARMDADDLMFPDRLKTQMEALGREPELVLVGTGSAILTPFGHIFERHASGPSRGVDTSILAKGRNFADPSVVFNRRIALEVGGFDAEFTSGDVPLWFRMLKQGKGWEITEPLHLYRIQPHSMSTTKNAYAQGVRVRSKYSPQSLVYWPDERDPSSIWTLIATLELLAGDGRAVREAARVLDHDDFSGIARQFRWLSYLGRAGYFALQYRHRRRRIYRHRPDWEHLFAPLLETDQKQKSHQCDNSLFTVSNSNLRNGT